jgi:hypothetical protein
MYSQVKRVILILFKFLKIYHTVYECSDLRVITFIQNQNTNYSTTKII